MKMRVNPKLEVSKLAQQYAIDNPQATAEEIAVMFPVRMRDAERFARIARDAVASECSIDPDPSRRYRPINNKAAIEAARKWASERHATREDLFRLFNITQMQARAIAKEFRSTERPAELVIVAREVVQLRDPVKLRRAEQQRIAAEVKASKPRRKLNKLHAVMCDGSMVDPKRVRDWTGWVGFTKVVV
jgi:hypothetical protein